MLDPLVLNFHEFDAISRIHDLSISVSNNKIRSQDLVIISNSSRSYPNNGKEKFTPIQFISRSSNKETRPRIPSLFRKHIYRMKKNTKEQQMSRCNPVRIRLYSSPEKYNFISWKSRGEETGSHSTSSS